MFSSAELIEALQRRLRRSLRPGLPAGEFPPGWQAWFAAIRERAGAVVGASSDAIIALLLQREPALPPARMAELNRWQAFATLWRQEWEPAASESRRERIAAYVITLVVHLLLAMLLVWLTYARLSGAPAPQGEEVVQVEYIGQGTPQDEGGGTPAGEVPEPVEAAPAKAAPRAQPAPPVPRTTAPARAELTRVPPPSLPRQPLPRPELPRPAPPSLPEVQPLAVTQTIRPDSSFVLTPVTPPAIARSRPQLVVPELQESPEAIELAVTPAPATVEQVKPELPTARIVVPEMQARAEALPQASLPTVRPSEVDTPQARVVAPALNAEVASLPAPPAPSAEAGQAASTGTTRPAQAATDTGTSGHTPGAAAAVPGGPPASSSGTTARQATAGSGLDNTARPGALPTPKIGEDWGISDRNRPGGQAGKPGLFDENGRPRLPAGTSAAPGGGLPPGIDGQDIVDLDHAGTWLKRPPIDYKPTRFDRFWIPGGTLLEEWVRRGIKELSLPIPGTSKKLHCVVSILQLGGGCGIDDPNMQDQEAEARPPPDIPFKPELQEDQGALARPPPAP